MTREEIIKGMDIKDNDKIYFVRIREDKKNYIMNMQRICIDINSYELLGILEKIQLEILMQMSGEIKPDVIERKVIKGE